MLPFSFTIGGFIRPRGRCPLAARPQTPSDSGNHSTSPMGGGCLMHSAISLERDNACPIGRRNHFLTLKCRKSGGGWFFLIGIKLPSAPSIYCSLPINTSLRSSVQLFSVHI